MIDSNIIQHNLIEVRTPSKGLIKIKPLTIHQQKEIISTTTNGIHQGVYLANVLNNIITTNSGINDLTILDRIPITLALRFDAFGTIVNDVDYGELKDKQWNIPEFVTNYTVGGSDLVDISISIPSLQKDTEINNYLIEVIESDEAQSIGNVVGSMYLFETVRFLDTVNNVNLNDYPIKDRVDFIENLPAAINHMILSTVKEVRRVENQFTKLGDNTLDIDAKLFTP